MKAIEYRHSWSSDKTSAQEMEEKFGMELVSFDESEAYEENEAKLFGTGKNYSLLTANGCSCWDGDWDGWEMSKEELITWAKKRIENEYVHAEEKLAEWILQNIK